jgi:hypothetical protein
MSTTRWKTSVYPLSATSVTPENAPFRVYPGHLGDYRLIYHCLKRRRSGLLFWCSRGSRLRFRCQPPTVAPMQLRRFSVMSAETIARSITLVACTSLYFVAARGVVLRILTEWRVTMIEWSVYLFATRRMPCRRGKRSASVCGYAAFHRILIL